MQITKPNSFKVRPLEIKFSESTSSKTGKKIVVCSIYALIEQPVGINGVFLFNRDFGDKNPWRHQEIYVTAKAVCADGDTYSKEIGEKVARAKAESKLYLALNNRVKSYFDDVKTAFEAMSCDFEKKTNLIIKHNQEYIKHITD